jgi:uncharacterized membrane protein YraQ (UPF0718 family)
VLGAASSSCSYAAVAIARSIFRKGANFTAAMAFEMASTNLVLELSIILIVLMGWQFMAAEAIAAPWAWPTHCGAGPYCSRTPACRTPRS